MICVTFISKFIQSKEFNKALLTVIVLTFILKSFCALDSFLHEWDERYHALVAKHLIQHPLTPTLYENPVEPYDHKNWVANHIWLSKPPLPLWFMSASIATFGTHEFAVRLPAIIFSLLSVLLTYRMGVILFSQKAGVIAALLHSIHGVLTDLASGRLSSDGVETTFLFFVSLGIFWVLRKPIGQFKLLDYIITGMITGLAFMSKWQPSLLVLIVLFIYHFDKKHFWKHSLYCTLSLFATMIVVLPWALYCFAKFPTEAEWMAEAIFHPMTIIIPGNDGTWYSYLTDFGNFFGYPTYVLGIISIYLAIKDYNRKLLTLAIWIAVPLMIFSAAEIKRGTYLMISAPAIFLLVAYFATAVVVYWKKYPISKWLAYVSIISMVVYSIERLYLFSNRKPRHLEWSDELKNRNPVPSSVIYDEPHAIELMFYHDVTAYPFSKKEN